MPNEELELKKEYHRQKSREWYQNNKLKQLARVKVNRQQYCKRNREFVWKYLKDKQCVDCGETDPVLFEFDHLRDKTGNVADLVYRQVSLETLLNEMSKCEVVCCNCHRRRTARRSGWLLALAGGSGLEPSKLDG